MARSGFRHPISSMGFISTSYDYQRNHYKIMKLCYYICTLEHLFVLSGLFWHLQIIFDITGNILDCLKSTFIIKLKEW